MAKNYLAMIADIEETESTDFAIDAKRVISPPNTTPISILATSDYGSLTRRGLRDALWLRTGLSRADADLVVGAYLESGILVELDGLVMVLQ